MTEIQVTMPFVWVDCTTCGVPFMITQQLYEAKRQYGGSVHCPNGHGVVREELPEADGEAADVRQQLESALQLASDEQSRRIEVEAALAQSVEDGDTLRRERDAARNDASKAEERWRDAEGELTEFGRVASAREEQHARELASLQALAERGRSVPEGVEVFTPPPLEDVRSEPQRQASTSPVEAWREERKECPNCHVIFGPEPRHRENTWRRKKFCSTGCQTAFNQQKAKERLTVAPVTKAAASGLEVPLAEKRVGDPKPEPESSPSAEHVPDAGIGAAGLDGGTAPELVHHEDPPPPPRQASVMLVRQGCDLVVNRSDGPPPRFNPAQRSSWAVSPW